jgi:hypothetical protein
VIARAEEISRAIPVNENAVNDARDWIRSAQPSLEEIEQRADARRPLNLSFVDGRVSLAIVSQPNRIGSKKKLQQEDNYGRREDW